MLRKWENYVRIIRGKKVLLVGGFSKDIGMRIREHREALGIRAEDLADKLGMDRATYYRYEAGNLKNMKLEKIQEIAKALGIHPDDLVVWEKDKPASGEDGLDAELIKRLTSLTPEEVAKVDAFVQGLLAAR